MRFFKTTRNYFLIILVLTFVLTFIKDERGLILVLFVGGAISFLSGTIFNLLYFLPTTKNGLKFLLPGIITLGLSIVIWHESLPDLIYFGVLGLINLALGLMTYFEAKKD